jgi:queuine tRNA-ribosyltransferase
MLEAVARGIDMFDCVMPTRNGRNSYAFTWRGTLRLRNAVHADDPAPLDADCRCETCRSFSRAYLRHLFLVDEMLGPTLLSIHNLAFYAELMRRSRTAIEAGTFAEFRASTLAAMEGQKAG